MGLTDKGIRWPEQGQSADLSLYLQQLAEDTDTRLVKAFTTAQRDAIPAGERWPGRLIWHVTAGQLERWDDTAGGGAGAWVAATAAFDPRALADGTLAAPAVAFAADTDTGLRRVAANELALVTGGVDRLIADAGGVRMARGVLGQPQIKDYTETFVDGGTGSGTYTLNLANANVYRRIINAASTIALSNVPPSGQAATVTLILQQSGGPHAVTWPAAFNWLAGAAPVMEANTRNIISAFTHDGGAIWYASYAGKM